MTEPQRPRVKYVIGPDGSPLTIADLPAPGTKRWVIRRKAEVVAAVRGGLLSLEEACSRYTLTVEEFLVLAVLDRPARPRRPAHHAHPAIPAISRLKHFRLTKSAARQTGSFGVAVLVGHRGRIRYQISRPCINPTETTNQAILAAVERCRRRLGNPCKGLSNFSERWVRRESPPWPRSPWRWSAFSRS